MEQAKSISNMMLFEKFKTGNSFKDAIVFAICMSLMTFLTQQIQVFLIDKFHFIHFQRILYMFSNKNMVSYEGKITCSTGLYDSQLRQSSIFTDRFKAIWEHIIKNISSNAQIHSIKEHTLYKKRNTCDENNNDTMYMVNQYDRFLVSKELDIYAYTYAITSDDGGEKNDEGLKGSKNKIEKIVIELFSYKNSIETIKEFVEDITAKYTSLINDSRNNKRFIYTLTKIKYEDCPCECWDENLFESTRTFKNLFFEGKMDVIEKVDYFLKNKEWYYNIGIPYSLGIGLHGPPGTGKTSFIKALANYTGRHIVAISLKLVKSKKQLDAVFFEQRYNTDNKKGAIGFDKKIIVFEDIDCIGDIVLDRDKKKKDSNVVLAKTVEGVDISTAITKMVTPLEDPPLTLDDILELWDGLRETPGRIMIMSSNHYADLDPALKRPGRIDITMKLSYASRKIIGEMYEHLFCAPLDPHVLEGVNDYFYTPAEIINIYINSEQNSQRFLERVLQNRHV